MKVLVTGAQGYIGSVLAPHLVEQGHAVDGLDTCFFEDAWLNIGAAPFPVRRGDVRGLDVAALSGYDAVVHLAELSNDPMGQIDAGLTQALNWKGSLRLARLAKDAGVHRFVYSSSCSVYGVGTGDLKNEDSAPNPQTEYAACKVRVEKGLTELADEGFSPTILRNATVYGLSPRFRFDLVVNNLAGWAHTAKEIRMTSDGSPWRPLIHVGDVARAFAAVLGAPRERVHAKVLNAGSTAENYQVRDVARIIADTFPGCALHVGNSDGDNRSYRVSFERIREAIPDFRPTMTVPRGVGELRQAFERVGLTAEMFRSRPFTRLEKLRHLMDSGLVDMQLNWQASGAAGAGTGAA